MILYHVEVHGKPETGRYEGYCAGRFKLLEKEQCVDTWHIGWNCYVYLYIWGSCTECHLHGLAPRWRGSDSELSGLVLFQEQ